MFLLYFNCVQSLLQRSSAPGWPILDHRPSLDDVKTAGVVTCVGRTEVGQGYDPVASSHALHHVVAAVFSTTAARNEREMRKSDVTACSKH